MCYSAHSSLSDNEMLPTKRTRQHRKQSALIEAQKDYQKAIKEKLSLLIQSLIRQIKYQSLIDMTVFPCCKTWKNTLKQTKILLKKHSPLVIGRTFIKCTSFDNSEARSIAGHQSRVTYLVNMAEWTGNIYREKYSNMHWTRKSPSPTLRGKLSYL